MYTYSATCVHVVDGDTLDLLVDLGFRMYKRDRFRLAGVDTPERGRPGYREAADYLRGLLSDRTLTLQSEKVSKWGYYLATLTLEDGRNVSQLMIEAGHAVAYDGRRKSAA